MSTIVQILRDLLERTSQPGLLGASGRKIENRCAEDVGAYFRLLAKKIDAAALGRLAIETNAGTAKQAAEMKVDRILRLESDKLYSVLTINIFEAIMVANKQVLLYKEADLPKVQQTDLDKLGFTGKEAAEYAARRAAQLVKDINKTTRTRIADAVSTSIEDRLGVGSLERTIRTLVTDMSKQRAQTIAATEMNDAMSEAALRKLKASSVEYKQIILSADACEICYDNADQDPLPVEENYRSGQPRPPFHPNCRCAITGARSLTGEDQ